jgi:hypothetical protein
MSKIELRLSNVDPPTPEPKRTIYRDIVNLPDPVKLGLTIRYFNHDDVDLYFQITGSATGYTFGTVNLGLLASGTDAHQNLDEFASRAKPSASDLPNGEKEENITLILKAYTDSGYANLKWTFERVVTVHWINSADPAFTVDFLDNFDDGTVQGWAVAAEVNRDGNPSTPAPTQSVVTDYVLSTPYSLRMTCPAGSGSADWMASFYKSFVTPNKDKVFAVIDLRVAKSDADYINFVRVMRDTTLLVHIGTPNIVLADYVPVNKWMRTVVPLPKNTTLTLKITVARRRATTPHTEGYMWLDDFKIVSK